MADKEKDERTVKGTMFVDYVRIIRTRKDINWEKYLTKEDLKIVQGRIFPMGWYPFATFRRCGLAALHEIANDDLNIVRQFGRMAMQNLVEKTYSHLMNSKDVFEAFQGLQAIRNRFFSFAAPTYEKVGPKSIRVSFENTPEKEEGLEPFCYQVVGNYDYLIELFGGKNVQLKWENKSWDGHEAVSFLMTWE